MLIMIATGGFQLLSKESMCLLIKMKNKQTNKNRSSGKQTDGEISIRLEQEENFQIMGLL